MPLFVGRIKLVFQIKIFRNPNTNACGDLDEMKCQINDCETNQDSWESLRMFIIYFILKKIDPISTSPEIGF